jgi:hypothetical protein
VPNFNNYAKLNNSKHHFLLAAKADADRKKEVRNIFFSFAPGFFYMIPRVQKKPGFPGLLSI